MSDQSRIKQVH